MRFTEVKELPRMRHKRNELYARLQEFMSMRTKIVKVEWKGTYNSAAQTQSNLYRGVQRGAFPIDVRRRGDDVYLINRNL